MKEIKQLTLSAPWGNIAVITWGSKINPPILLCHGYMDTAATFIPLIEKLPNTYYFIGFDQPGHGLSDPLPPGPLPNVVHFVEAMRVVVKKMNLERFYFMGHSMAALVGGFYNAVFPNQISRMINIDPEPPISMYFSSDKFSILYDYLYGHYYLNFERYVGNKPRIVTLEEAIDSVVRTRNLTEEQAETILSRSLISVSDGKYRLMYDHKMKKIAIPNLSKEALITIFTKHSPVTLNVYASIYSGKRSDKKFGQEIAQKVLQECPHHYTVFAKGAHDVHITNPEEVSSHVIEFLAREIHRQAKSKL